MDQPKPSRMLLMPMAVSPNLYAAEAVRKQVLWEVYKVLWEVGSRKRVLAGSDVSLVFSWSLGLGDD